MSALPFRAKFLFTAVVAAAAAATVLSFQTLEAGARDWLTFAALGIASAGAQIVLLELRRNHGFALAVPFLLAGALLLPAALVALIPLVQHLPNVARRRIPLYIETFNAANYVLNALAAYGVAHLAGGVLPESDVRWAAAGIAAAVAFVALNHSLLAAMLLFARGHSLRSTGLLSADSLSIDLVLALLGVGLAAFWKADPALVVAAVAPLLLVHRFLALRAQLTRATA